jgi:hypothetical protein
MRVRENEIQRMRAVKRALHGEKRGLPRIRVRADRN